MNTNQNGQMPQTNNKKSMVISGIVILVVIIALIAAPRLKGTKGDEVPAEQQENVEQVATTTASGDAGTVLTRADATAQYAGKTIRFSGDCQAEPEALTVAAGTTVMLDNATAARQAITVGTKNYSVGAERYTLTWMNAGKGEFAVTCGGKAAGNIIVQ